jgi:DNA-directed RNA polymerase specialized sigma24 family protein
MKKAERPLLAPVDPALNAEAAAWLAKHAPDLAKSVTRELRAPRLDTGESAGAQAQVPQKHGEESRVVLSLQGLTIDPSADVDGETVSGVGLGRSEDDEDGVDAAAEASGPGLTGRWRQASIRELWGALEGSDPEAVSAVRKIVEDLPPSQQEIFQLIYVERLSEREAGRRLGCSQQAAHGRVTRLRSAVMKAGAFPPAL